MCYHSQVKLIISLCEHCMLSYRKSGSKRWLSKIRVPCIAINARDDPFIDEKSLPTDADLYTSSDMRPESVIGLVEGGENNENIAPVRLIYTYYGGHCGFLSSLLASDVPSHGWLSEELSRSLQHISYSFASTG